MTTGAHFQFDPRLAVILGENYRSSEQALKELIDNAWDADARSVRVALPNAMTKAPIVIEDDGTGMTEKEVRNEYLKVASDRRTRKGAVTPGFKRLVKGRKGIGKFAGLMAASTMELRTCARGTETLLRINKEDLLHSPRDLEDIDLPVNTKQCGEKEHGTTIILTDLSQALQFPKPERFRELLVLEYGRATDFLVYVNGEGLAVEDVAGEQVKREVEIPGVGKVLLNFTIAEPRKRLKNPGVVVRVGGKVVGRPLFFGLEDEEELPARVLHRIYGEIDADGLASDVTADWGAIIENSTAFGTVSGWAREQLKGKVEQVFKSDIKQARVKREHAIQERLHHLPEHKRKLAEDALERVLMKFYGESEDRIDTVIAVMLDSFERDEYWSVIHAIERARHAGVARFAEALGQFGLVDMAVMSEQARNRLSVLAKLEELVTRQETKEKDLHVVIEHNLWLFEGVFSLVSSNKTLGKVLAEWLEARKRAKHRPDLLLCDLVKGGHLLVEFKEPRHSISREDEAQAISYRDDLRKKFERIEVVVIGAGRPSRTDASFSPPGLTVMSYEALIGGARSRLEWLLRQLRQET